MESTVQVKIQGIDNSKEAFASLNKNLQGVQKATSSVRDKVEKLRPAFQKMASVGALSSAALVAGAKQSIAAYAEVERAQRQLTNAVIGVSKGTQEQVEQINQLTAALEKKAGVDADSLTMGVAQLSTFGLQTDSVLKLTKSLADFTVNQNGLNASSDQYITSANTIAKALKGQFGILEKSGIRFTDAQKAIIEYGTESERVAAVQEGLAQNLRETTDTVNGVDLAMAKTQRTMENINENIGKSLAPAFLALAENVQPIIERVADWSEKNPELIQQIAMITAAIAALVTVLGVVGLAMLAISAPAVILVGTLAGIGLVVYSLNNAVKSLGTSWTGVWTLIKDATLSAIDAMLGPLDEIVSLVEKALKALAKLPGVKLAAPIVKKAFSSVTDLFGGERAEGGPVANGKGYIVGERGPEWFMPQANGTIIPNNALAGAGGGNTNINLYISGTFMDDRSAAKRLAAELMGQLKQNTRL